jgi:HTH-type transcriptional regulator / antitoxin HigA
MGAVAEKVRYAYEPDYASPPGETLSEILERRGMSQVELATRTGLSPKHVNQIIKGVAPITPDTALDLEKVTGVPARTWNALEATYRSLVSRKEEEAELEADVGWLDELPIKELAKRGYIQLRKPPIEQVRVVCQFFGVASRAAWKTLWKPTAFRKAKAYESDPGALATWLRIGEIEAAKIPCLPYNRKKFESALREARTLTREDSPDKWLPKLQRAFSEAGVALVIVPEIGKTRANGATRWLSPDKAIIQLSGRQKWSDIFWFTLFHEAGHILRHSKKETFINEGASDEEIETEADSFAARWLVPREFEPELEGTRLADVPAVASKVGVGTDVIVGRLQHEGSLKHSQGRDFRTLLDPFYLESLSRETFRRSEPSPT